jgi:protein subunit release factor A
VSDNAARIFVEDATTLITNAIKVDCVRHKGDSYIKVNKIEDAIEITHVR